MSESSLLRWFAVAAPGLEALVEAEVRALPAVAEVNPVAGGVEFSGDLALGMRANLWLRVATRVLLRVATVRAREFAALRRLLGQLPWERWVSSSDPLRVQASASKSRLYHTGALAEAVVAAIGDRLGGCGREPPALSPRLAPGESPDDERDPVAAGEPDAPGAPAEGEVGEGEAEGEAAPVAARAPETRVLLRGVSDQWTVSVDSSGELLHRRGWRIEGGRAPLRETLAAALLQLAGYDPQAPLLDPMCGSGTIALEAASLAAGRAPGAGRSFAFSRWPGFDPPRWQALLREPGSNRSGGSPGPGIFAWDRDPRAVARARRNAERAGLQADIDVAQASFGEPGSAVAPPEALARLRERSGARPGLVLINPPYGRRLSDRPAAARLVKTIGRTLRAHFPGWRAGVLLAEPGWASALGLPIQARLGLRNGGLRLTLVLASVPAVGTMDRSK